MVSGDVCEREARAHVGLRMRLRLQIASELKPRRIVCPLPQNATIFPQTRHHEVTMLGAPPQNLLSFGVGGKMNGSPKEEVTPIQSAIGSFVPSVLQF
jgi:hypothetical protein